MLNVVFKKLFCPLSLRFPCVMLPPVKIVSCRMSNLRNISPCYVTYVSIHVNRPNTI